MNAVISICIPTCNRPALLKLAIESCFRQLYRPLEIVIGDDSISSESQIGCETLQAPAGIVIRYHRNAPQLGQSGNVNRLFDVAEGSRLLLLHDDDLLCPGGLDILAHSWEVANSPLCVYGRQYVVDPHGTTLAAETANWNKRYFRTEQHEGPQWRPLVAALWQQVPNNCYLVDTAAARATRYRPESEVGQCVDAEFIVRLGQEAERDSFVYVDRFISQYRLTPASIARSKHLNRRQDLFFEIVQAVTGDADTEAAKELTLSRISVGAALDAAMAGRRQLALGIVFSRFYGRPLLSRWTLYRLVCAVSPRLGARLKQIIDARLIQSDRRR